MQTQLRFYFNSWLFRLPLLRNYSAITLLPFGVFFSGSQAEVDPRTLNHELVHVEQIERLGLLKFYVSYLWHYLKNLIKYRNHDLAYHNIPFEVEAREREGALNA